MLQFTIDVIHGWFLIFQIIVENTARTTEEQFLIATALTVLITLFILQAIYYIVVLAARITLRKVSQRVEKREAKEVEARKKRIRVIGGADDE